jgi:hypothetical protein
MASSLLRKSVNYEQKSFITFGPDGVAEARVDADDVELEVGGLLLHDLDLETRLEVVDNLLTSSANLRSSSSQ